MDNLLTYESGEQLTDFISFVTKPGRVAIPDKEVPNYMHYYMLAVSMTRLKLAGIVWFDDEIYPVVPEIKTNVTLNLEFKLKDTRDATEKYKGMTLTTLSGLASRLEKPEWAKENAN